MVDLSHCRGFPVKPRRSRSPFNPLRANPKINPYVVSLRLQNYGRISPLRLRGLFSLRQGYGGQGDAKEPDFAGPSSRRALPIAPVAARPEPALPIRMCIVGVSAWSPVVAWAIKARSSEGDDDPGIGWFRAEDQCRKQHRKGD
jgi:hypothetical protein